MSCKFIPRFVGPFLITALNPLTSNYTITFPPHFKVHPRVHASKLRPHFPNDATHFPARHFSSPDLPDLADPTNSPWTIEKVVLDRAVGTSKRRKFLVRFLGYSLSEDLWLTEEAMERQALELLRAYVSAGGGVLQLVGEKKVRRVK
jgi:hypothetical protein